METNMELKQYLLSGNETDIEVRRGTPLPWIGLLVVGLVLLVLSFRIASSDILSTVLVTVGFLCAAVGAVMIFVALRIPRFVYKPTGSVMRQRRVYLRDTQRQQIAETLADDSLAGLEKLEKVVSSNTQLLLLVARDGSCAAVQPTEFVESHFEPTGAVRLVRGQGASRVEAFLRSK